jgi:hypothetical protein
MVNVQIAGKSCPTYRKSLRLSFLRNRRIKLARAFKVEKEKAEKK